MTITDERVAELRWFCDKRPIHEGRGGFVSLHWSELLELLDTHTAHQKLKARVEAAPVEVIGRDEHGCNTFLFVPADDAPVGTRYRILREDQP